MMNNFNHLTSGGLFHHNEAIIKDIDILSQKVTHSLNYIYE